MDLHTGLLQDSHPSKQDEYLGQSCFLGYHDFFEASNYQLKAKSLFDYQSDTIG